MWAFFYTTQQFSVLFIIISYWSLLLGDMLKHTVKILFIQNSSLSVLNQTYSLYIYIYILCIYSRACKNDIDPVVLNDFLKKKASTLPCKYSVSVKCFKCRRKKFLI